MKDKIDHSEKQFSTNICMIYAIIIFICVCLTGFLALRIFDSSKKEVFRNRFELIAYEHAQMIQHMTEHAENAAELVETALILSDFEPDRIVLLISDIFKSTPYISAFRILTNKGGDVFFPNSAFNDDIACITLLSTMADQLPDLESGAGIMYSRPVQLDDSGKTALIGYKSILYSADGKDVPEGRIYFTYCVSRMAEEFLYSRAPGDDQGYRIILENGNVQMTLYSNDTEENDWHTYYSLPVPFGTFYFQAPRDEYKGTGNIVLNILVFMFALSASAVYYLQHMKLLSKTKQIDSLNRKLRDLLITDSLTNIRNRRGVYEFLDAFLPYAERNKILVSVAMLDIDNFKEINDKLGHEGGDEALKFFAAVYQSRVRSSDIIGRFGGDEFVCVFPDCNIKNAVKIGESLRRELAFKTFRHGEYEINIQFSMGITQFLFNQDNVESLIGRADKALYEAKNTGKDRIVCV